MPEPGKAQRLRALAHPDVQHPQPLPDGVPSGYLLVQLARDQLLPYDVPQPAQLLQPRLRDVAGERRAQSFVPRLTCGFGSRSRRIWSERISA